VVVAVWLMPRTKRRMPGVPAAGVGLLLLLCGACGGGSASGSGQAGALTLQAVWERPTNGGGAQFEGSADVPASVQTVEVRIEADGQSFGELVDPDQTTSVLITGVPAGRADVSVLGYDVPLLGSPDLREVDVAPSYASETVQIIVSAGRTTNAGPIEVTARPFLTGFSPLPEETGVDPSSAVEFLLAIAVGDIDAGSVDVAVDGAALVSAGIAATNVVFEPCTDGTATPCGAADQGLSGFLLRGPPDALPTASRVAVSVQALGGPDTARALDFEYGFDTGDGSP
jgi:hypothetical protein